MPFELMTGCIPRTISGSVLEAEPPSEPLGVATIKEAAAEYRRVALAHADYMRTLRADTLNRHGRALRALKVGDYVKIYMPPSHDEAVRRQRKAKHIVQFRGPLKITKKLSSTTFELSCYFNPSSKFRRHLTNIRRWVGPLPKPDDSSNGVPPASHDDIAVGDFLFVRDEPDANEFQLAEVTDADYENLQVHLYGRTARDPKTAQFRPVHIMSDGRPQLRKPRASSASTPWTWTILTEHFDDLVVASGCALTGSGCLTAATAALLPRLRPLRLRRMRYGSR